MPELPFWIALAAMLIGLAGTILPAVPGIGLIWGAALVYAIIERFATIDPLTFAVLTCWRRWASGRICCSATRAANWRARRGGRS